MAGGNSWRRRSCLDEYVIDEGECEASVSIEEGDEGDRGDPRGKSERNVELTLWIEERKANWCDTLTEDADEGNGRLDNWLLKGEVSPGDNRYIDRRFGATI